MMHGCLHDLTAVFTAMEYFHRLSNKVPSLTGPAGVDNEEIASVPLQGSCAYFDRVCSTNVTGVKLTPLGLQDLPSTKSCGRQIRSWHCLLPKHCSLEGCIMLPYRLLTFATSSENPKILQSLHVAARPLSAFELFTVVVLSLPMWLQLWILHMTSNEM